MKRDELDAKVKELFAAMPKHSEQDVSLAWLQLVVDDLMHVIEESGARPHVVHSVIRAVDDRLYDAKTVYTLLDFEGQFSNGEGLNVRIHWTDEDFHKSRYEKDQAEQYQADCDEFFNLLSSWVLEGGYSRPEFAAVIEAIDEKVDASFWEYVHKVEGPNQMEQLKEMLSQDLPEDLKKFFGELGIGPA